MDEDFIKAYRLFLKDSLRKVIDFSQTDQNRGVAPPPVQKPCAPDAERIDLTPCDRFGDLGKIDGQDEFTIYLASVGKKR